MLNHQMIEHHEHRASLGEVSASTGSAIFYVPMLGGLLLGGYLGVRTFGKSSAIAGLIGGAFGAYAGFIAGILGGALLYSAVGGEEAPSTGPKYLTGKDF